jgi:hypothetical protein
LHNVFRVNAESLAQTCGLEIEFRINRGCRVEAIMKDNNTIQADPSRVVRWVRIAREEAESL